MSDQLVKQHIASLLKFDEEHDAREEALLDVYEAKGHRIVSGGQVDHDTWEVVDYRTGDTIIEGGGGIDGYGAAVAEHGENWVHIDPITEPLYDTPDPTTEGLPESLCRALAEWVRDKASPEDIRALMEG
ncbi:hypothetical protein [Marinactinospora rubrisoli]|uniref:Immunity protein Imm1 n=1 Tax=Marinactinospora rubrisoli TaxID=2715399 RepID=A0ABW2KFQ6_9ACTN